MAVGNFMPNAGQGSFGGLTQPYQEQQSQQAGDDEATLSQKMMDPNVREEAAAILAAQGLEPPSDLSQLVQPTTPPVQDQGTGAQMNQQISPQMLDQVNQTQQGTPRGGGNG